MKVVLLLAFVVAANAAWLCPNGDVDCDPGECCVRSFLLNVCDNVPQRYDECNPDPGVSDLCNCPSDAGLTCVAFGTSTFSSTFTGDGWCVDTPGEAGSGNGA